MNEHAVFRVLLVDDEVLIRMMVSDMLERSVVPSSSTIGSSKRFDQPCGARAKAGLLS